MRDPRNKQYSLDEETIEVLEIIEECKDAYALDDDFLPELEQDY